MVEWYPPLCYNGILDGYMVRITSTLVTISLSQALQCRPVLFKIIKSIILSEELHIDAFKDYKLCVKSSHHHHDDSKAP